MRGSGEYQFAGLLFESKGACDVAQMQVSVVEDVFERFGVSGVRSEPRLKGGARVQIELCRHHQPLKLLLQNQSRRLRETH